MGPGKTSRPGLPGIDLRSLQGARRGVVCFLAGLVIGLLISAGWSAEDRGFIWSEKGLLLSVALSVWFLSLLFFRGALQPLVEAVEKLEKSVRRIEKSLRTGAEGPQNEIRVGTHSGPPPMGSRHSTGAEDPGRSDRDEDRPEGWAREVEPGSLLGRELQGSEPAASDLFEGSGEIGGDPMPVGELMAAWNRYLSEGDGSFNRAGFLEFFEASHSHLQIWPGDELELGNSVLIAGRSLGGELLLLPNFNKAPRELSAWFDSESGPRNPRVQQLIRPATAKRWIHGAKVEVRGLVS